MLGNNALGLPKVIHLCESGDYCKTKRWNPRREFEPTSRLEHIVKNSYPGYDSRNKQDNNERSRDFKCTHSAHIPYLEIHT